MHDPKWCLFYDNHTMAACPDVGAAFDVDAFVAQIKSCGVDFLAFHARCNQGMAYYDTKIGTRHPSLRYDLFEKLAAACQREGIALSAYFNAGLSHDEGQKHRDWLVLNPEGKTRRGDALYVHCPEGLDSGTLNLRPFDRLPSSAVLLNTGEPVAFTLDQIVYERSLPPALRLRGLEPDKLAGAVPVFKLLFN